MSDISTEQLRKEIVAILKTADLSIVSAKKVREQVEKKLNCSLMTRKKEFDAIVMDFINQQHEGINQNDGGKDNQENDDANGDDSAESIEDASSEEEEVIKPKKRPQPTQARKTAPKKKRKSVNSNDSGTESDGDSDSDYEMPKKVAAKKKKSGGGGGGAATGRKSTGFTRAYNLSPELSALMGSDSLPRHEVVKKVWAIIKERNLYDPKNKQYAICDDELMKVMKVKRFRTFGMLKHLKPHFLG